MIVLNTSHKLIFGAAAALFAAGTALAIVQPGDLGDDEIASGPTSTTLGPTTTTEPAVTTTIADTTTSSASATSTTLATTSTTLAATTTTAATGTTTTLGPATTTTVGSGLGAEGSGTVNPDGTVADTGIESQLPLGLALLGVALASRKLLRPRS